MRIILTLKCLTECNDNESILMAILVGNVHIQKLPNAKHKNYFLKKVLMSRERERERERERGRERVQKYVP